MSWVAVLTSTHRGRLHLWQVGPMVVVMGLHQSVARHGVTPSTVLKTATVRAAGQTQGVRVNLETGQQDELIQRSTFVSGTASMLAQGVRLADLDVEGLSFVMQGSWINHGKPMTGQAILVNRNIEGQVTLWAATLDASMTKAV
eukprot:gene12345-16627_t